MDLSNKPSQCFRRSVDEWRPAWCADTPCKPYVSNFKTFRKKNIRAILIVQKNGFDVELRIRISTTITTITTHIICCTEIATTLVFETRNRTRDVCSKSHRYPYSIKYNNVQKYPCYGARGRAKFTENRIISFGRRRRLPTNSFIGKRVSRTISQFNEIDPIERFYTYIPGNKSTAIALCDIARTRVIVIG